MAFKIANFATILATVVALASATETENLRKLSWNHTKTIAHQVTGAFVDGAETLYDDHSLAWRFLGFYTDCNVCVDGGDGDDDNGNYDEELMDAAECAENGQDTVCRRYALWAAYVDEGYEGNGKNEYLHYDRKHKRWDDSLCGENSSRCVKMDCHDPYSKNFKLVGVYKDSQIDTMLDNMIGYGGDCVWNDDDYKFMQAMNYNQNNNKYSTAYWPPKTCTAIQKNNNGSVRGYYDAKPASDGKLEMALYSDYTCETPHQEQERVSYKLEHMMGRSASDIEKWNDAMDAFKICQPCVSYDTFFVGNKQHNKKNRYNANGDRYGYQKQGDDDAANGYQPFVCRTNLQQDEPTNQCQVLLEGDDTMTVASYRDILLAESQGTVTGIDLSPASESHRGKLVMGEPFVRASHKWLSILLLLFSITYFFVALSNLFEMDKGSKNKSLKESLVGKTSRSGRSRSPKRVVTAPIVQITTQKERKPQQKKSIMKKSNFNDDDSQESAPYAIL